MPVQEEQVGIMELHPEGFILFAKYIMSQIEIEPWIMVPMQSEKRDLLLEPLEQLVDLIPFLKNPVQDEFVKVLNITVKNDLEPFIEIELLEDVGEQG